MIKENSVMINSKTKLQEMLTPVFSALSQSELRGYIFLDIFISRG